MDSKLILIVEDYEDDAKLLQLLLANCCISNAVRTTLSAEDAINYLGGVPPFSNVMVYLLAPSSGLPDSSPRLIG